MADIERVLQELPAISEMLFQMYKDETDKESISVRYDQYLAVSGAVELLKGQREEIARLKEDNKVLDRENQMLVEQMFGSDLQVLWLGTDEVTREELFKRHFEANFTNLTRQIDNDEPPFLSYVQFIIWISAYYPAPSKMVSEKEFKANKETWYRFFREMKELQEKGND